MLKEQKKRWKKPKLIVVMKVSEDEAVLSGCKTGTSGTSSHTIASGCNDGVICGSCLACSSSGS